MFCIVDFEWFQCGINSGGVRDRTAKCMTIIILINDTVQPTKTHFIPTAIYL